MKKITEFMDCFMTTPAVGELSLECWGAATVGKRDQDNGLEDKLIGSAEDGERYCYWDGAIIKEDGKYYMLAARWPEKDGHWGWPRSKAVIAESDSLYGPYEDKGLLYPDFCESYGHNVFPFFLNENEAPLGKSGMRAKYGLVLGDTFMRELRSGIFVTEKVTGPWEFIGQMKIEAGEGTNGVFARSNVGILPAKDGGYIAYDRNGNIATAEVITGPWYTRVENLWSQMAPLAGKHDVEDPVMWYSNGLYHCIANRWDERRAYYMTSEDGIHGWRMRKGTAYTPNGDYIRYEDGTVNHWNKLERPNVYMEDGRVVAFTLSVIDIPKDEDLGGDAHGSKIVVIPFDHDALCELDADPSTFLE